MVAQQPSWLRQAIVHEGAATRARCRRGGIKLLPRLFQAMISLPAMADIGTSIVGRSRERGIRRVLIAKFIRSTNVSVSI